MSDTGTTETIAEGAVSGNQASIPAAIREQVDIEDGDKLRWYWKDGDLSVEVIRQRSGVFEGFDGFDGESESIDHDVTGLDTAGERDAETPRE